MLSKRGCRLLAIAVISAAVESAKKNNDYTFFYTSLYHFYAGLAYGGKEEYMSEEDVVNAVKSRQLEKDLKKIRSGLRNNNGGQHSKYR